MSATIPESMLLSELLKPTGFDCPEEFIGKTFNDATTGDGEMDSNKAVTIDVSTYTQPVAISPTDGKIAMKKVTVTLSNIPAGGVTKLYGWYNETSSRLVYTTVENPTTSDFAYDTKGDGKTAILDAYEEDGTKYIQLNLIDYETYARNSDYDLTF